MANLEQLWVAPGGVKRHLPSSALQCEARVHRRMPAWSPASKPNGHKEVCTFHAAGHCCRCRGADGRALLRGFLHPGAPPLSLSVLEEMSEELSTPDELQLEAAQETSWMQAAFPCSAGGV